MENPCGMKYDYHFMSNMQCCFMGTQNLPNCRNDPIWLCRVVNRLCLTLGMQVRRTAGAGASRGMALYEEEVTASYIFRIKYEIQHLKYSQESTIPGSCWVSHLTSVSPCWTASIHLCALYKSLWFNGSANDWSVN